MATFRTPTYGCSTSNLAVREKPLSRQNLNVVPLDETGEYEAPSNVWGKKTRKRAMKCDATTIDAKGNLVDALKHLRLSDRTRVL